MDSELQTRLPPALHDKDVVIQQTLEHGLEAQDLSAWHMGHQLPEKSVMVISNMVGSTGDGKADARLIHQIGGTVASILALSHFQFLQGHSIPPSFLKLISFSISFPLPIQALCWGLLHT